jgi:hemerythrin
MPIIEWSSTFKLGVQKIDEHHQHLVRLLNKVYDDFANGAPIEQVGVVLDELFDYATYHFGAEEDWMKANSYPGLAGHIDQHEEFSGKLVGMVNSYQNGKPDLNSEVFTFLTNWLLQHILKSDAAFVQYAVERSA